MSNYRIRNFTPAALVLTAMSFGMHSPGVSAGSGNNASDHRTNHHHHQRPLKREKTIRGVTVIGTNDVLGKPFFSWGQPYGSFFFPNLGVYNPAGTEPLPIDENTPPDAVLATVVDPNLLVVSNATPADVKPEWVNVPLRNILVNRDFFFVTKGPLLGALSSLPLQQSQVEPAATPITLGQWMQGSGTINIVCKGAKATFDLRMRKLLPKRMYTVWGTFGLPHDGSATTFYPIPLGGTPNMMITDINGNASLKRSLNFCPFDPESTRRPLLTINVQFHGNHESYGGVPEPAFIHGYWPGLVTFTQVQFPVNVEVLDR